MIFKNRKSSLCLDVLFMLFIAVVCVWNLKDIGHIRVVDDEFVYWGIGAALSGFDWKDLLSVSQYYSFGYSFLLVPLFWLTKIGVSMTAIYRIAIFFNVLFLWGSYFVACRILNELEVRLPDFLKQISSFFAVLYIGNVVQINLAWTECCLCFVYWLVIYLLVKVCKNPNYKNAIFLLLATAYIFMVHMRAVGVVIAVGIVLGLYIIFNFKQLYKKWMLSVVIEAAVLVVITLFIKNAITNVIYLGGAVNSVNNVSANIEKAQSLLSISGFIDLMMSVLGKLFYASAASFLTATIGMFFAIAFLVKQFWNREKKKQSWNAKEWVILFVLLAFLGENGISAIFKCFKYFSADVTFVKGDEIVFGRYSDFVIGPMIVLGVYVICNIKKYIKEVLVSLLFFIGMAVCVQMQFDILAFYNGSENILFRDHSAFWAAYLYNGTVDNFAYYIAIISIFVGGVLWICSEVENDKKNILSIGLISISIFWGICGINYSADYIEEKQNKKKDIETVYNIINVTDKSMPIYLICGDDNKAFVDIKVLQWMLGERSVHIYDVDDIQQMDVTNAILLCDSNAIRRKALLSDYFKYVYNSGTISVYIDAENTDYDLILDKAEEMNQTADSTKFFIELSDIITEYSYIKANGDLYYNYQASEGAYLTGNTGVTLSDGTYEFYVDMRVKDCSKGTDIGYIVVGDSEENVQYTYILTADAFIEKERQMITLPIEIKGFKEPFIGIYTYGEASMRIYDIYYKQIIGNTNVITEEVAELINGVGSEEKICYIDSDNSSKTGFPMGLNSKSNYLSGEMVKHKEKFTDDYYLVEKITDEKLFEVLAAMEIVDESENYILYEKVSD